MDKYEIITTAMKKPRIIDGELSDISNGWLMIKNSETGEAQGFIVANLLSIIKVNK